MKAILIDDEKHATELLDMKLRKLDMNVQVMAKFNQPEAALEFIRHTAFDVLFLDIEMPRMNGFSLLEEVGDFHFDVIFTTAYDQYAIRAFRFSALNYLLKPIQENELREAIGLWQQRKVRQLQQTQYQLFQEHYQTPASPGRTRVALPTQEGHEIIDVSDIVRCTADASYTHFFLQDNSSLLICRTLKEVGQALEPCGFVRVHHSHLINPAYLRKIVRQEGGYLLMADGAQVPVNKPKRDYLLELLGSIERR
ncbi:LytR/AlgR family response regulator transcription factor [Spirosoma sordidisoli]|uniref:Response regulator transcription factor n=1 Tax=Spirosoma sordidisoli TaxID=2502893 RepID=A0A4Q2UPG9_9BACT|nr:LytTR family DNA-binding domain-containing protein [Spirosoma sordidisoli]RYC71354.1 response regulator transcription factor [Spirosoma sordidisoli]